MNRNGIRIEIKVRIEEKLIELILPWCSERKINATEKEIWDCQTENIKKYDTDGLKKCSCCTVWNIVYIL